MTILEEAEELKAYLTSFKKDLHIHPELSFEEYRTTERIKDNLEEMGVEILDLGLQTGVVARIKGEGGDGPTIALRADIDAISQEESTAHRIRSLKEGVMHACGHDFHTASLIGAAKLLSERRKTFTGEVLLIFQPAEEITKGAQYLIDHGLFKTVPSAVFGIHNRPEIECGKIAVKEGPLMAGKSHFKITVYGKAGHGGSPHKCSDVILCASSIIETLQMIVSRNTAPQDALVLSVLSIHAGSEENFVPEKLVMTGSVRALSEKVLDDALRRIEEIADYIAKAQECKAETERIPDVPVTNNHEKVYPLAYAAATKIVGEENIVVPLPDMGSEDFSVYAKQTPSFFYWVGSGYPDKENVCWHNKSFETDDRALPIAAALYAQSALDALQTLM